MTGRITRRLFSRRLGPALALSSAAPLWGRASVVRAAPIAAEASARVSTETTRVGEPVQLTLELKVKGARAPAQLPWPEDLIGAFDVSNVMSGGGWSGDLFGGAASRIYTQQTSALITPKKAGAFDLGFSVEIGGETFTSNVPTLEVLEAGAALPEPPPGRAPTEAPGPGFLWATVDKTEVYVGEQLSYSLDVYERRSFLGIHLRKPPSFTDFFTEELPEGEPVVRRVGDADFRVRPGLRRALFPQRSGSLQVGSAELRVGRQSILSRPITIDVRPLPAEGRPAGFSPNNVGRFTIASKVDRTSVSANDPVTLSIVIEGEGNVQFVDPGPWPEIDGVRRYDPKVDTRLRKGSVLGGERRYEFLLIPERGGSITIPSHALVFFDPESERYEVARSESIELEVSGGEAPEAEAEAEPAAKASDEEIAAVVGGEILPRHAPRERWLTPSRWLYGMLAVPVLAAVGQGGSALWRRFGADESARARARRRQRQRALMESAEQAVEQGTGFHGALTTLLQEIAVDRAGPDGIGLPRPELLRLLGQRGVPPADVERLRDLLDRCDAARFGAQGDGPEERRALLEEVLDLVRTSRLVKEAP